MNYELNEKLAKKVLDVVANGLTKGLGSPAPGKMCIEAAVCYAMGLPHSDNPTCVGSAVRSFKIKLNDSNWSSNKARADGMRKLAIAQLGSDEIDQEKFVRILVEQTIKKIIPMALRVAKKKSPKHADKLESAALNCEKEGSKESAMEAKQAAYDAAASAAYAADAYAASAAAADADAAYASAADSYAASAGAADAYAASAASATYDAADADAVLIVSAEIGLQALIECGSPGCKYLYLCEDSV